MPAQLWTFESTNQVVTQNLTAAEIAAVATWQQLTNDWSFEFHTGHLTGKPIYIRPAGNTATHHLTKMDTKNKALSHYQVNGKLVFTTFSNANHVNACSARVKADIESVITNNYQLLQELARRFYGEIAPQNAAAAAAAPAAAAAAAPAAAAAAASPPITTTCTACEKGTILYGFCDECGARVAVQKGTNGK